MKTIRLTQNKYTIVDDGDFKILSQHTWHFNCGYARRRVGKKILAMHRFLLNSYSGKEIDHRNGNKLDNRRKNLRLATRKQNMRNKGIYKNNTSGFKGISWNKKSKKWVSRISSNSGRIFLGHFSNLLEASKVYKKAKLKYHGEFAFAQNN